MDQSFLIYLIETLFGILSNAAVQKIDNCNIFLIIAENEFLKDILCNICDLKCDIIIKIYF